MGRHQTVFGGLSIAFDEHVLRPRQWTTSHSHWAAELLPHAPDGSVLELCSGAGHIGLLTISLHPRALVQVDVDARACAFARLNARVNGFTGVDVRQGEVDRVLHDHERFAGIIADPPWVPRAHTGRFPEDPLVAIDGGPDGMDLAWACVDVIAHHLADRGWALVQLGTRAQAEALHDRLSDSPGLSLEVAAVREYGDRGVVVHLAHPSAG